MGRINGTYRKALRASLFLLGLIASFLALAGTANAQVPVPGFSKIFSPDTIGPGSTSTLTFTIDNSALATPVTNLDFTDPLPSLVTIATPANASTNCADAILSAPDGGGTISFMDGRLGAGGTCTVQVDVTSSTVGTYSNFSNDLTSSAGNSGTASDDLMVVSTLPSFAKSFSPTSVAFGGKSTLTFTIDNSANASGVNNLDFTDNFPGGMTIASPANAGTTCGTATIPPTLTAPAGGSSVILDSDGVASFPAVAAGATCTVNVDVIANQLGSLNNISGDLLADFVSAGNATAALTVTGTPLLLTKSFNGDPVLPGSNVDLEFTIQNGNRVDSATSIAFSDDLAAALTGLTFDSLTSNTCGGTVGGVGTTSIMFSGGTLGAEGSCAITASLSVPGAAATGSYTNTTSSITADIGGNPTVGAAATDDLFIEAALPILTKSFTNDPIGSGDTVTLEFTIQNPNAGGPLTDLTFTDELTTYLPFPVTATFPAAGFCGGGSTISLISPNTDVHSISVTGASVPASSSCTFSVDIDIPAGVSGGSYLNTTSDITGTFAAAPVTGPPATDTLVVNGGATITLGKEFTDDPVLAGASANLRFTLTSAPESTDTATALAFTDDLTSALAGLTFDSLTANTCGGTVAGVGTTMVTFTGGTLAAAATCTIDVATTVPGASSAGTYTNTTGDLSGTAGGVSFTAPAASADLIVGGGLSWTKEFMPDTVAAGDTTNLRFTITNDSTSTDATISFFTDSLSTALAGLAATGGPTTDTCGGTLSGTTTLIYIGGAVTQGTSCTIDVPVLVPAAAADGTYNSASSALTAVLGSPVTIDPATDVLTVQEPIVDVALTKEFTDDPVEAGGTATLEFVLTNSSVDMVTDFNFSDDLDAMLSGTTATGALFNDCNGMAGFPVSTFSYSGGTIPAMGSCTIRISVLVPAATAGSYTNTTSDLTATVGGIVGTSAAATDDLLVGAGTADFTKTFGGPVASGGTTTLEFSITNTGMGALSDLRFTDDLSAVLTGLAAEGLPANDICGTGSQISGTGSLAFTGGNLAVGANCTFSVNVKTAESSAAGTYPNSTSDLISGASTVASAATDSIVVVPPPAFSKVFAPDTIFAGGVSTLTFTIDNSVSTATASALDFTDVMPIGVTIAATPNASTTCTGGTITAVAGSGAVSYSGGSVASGASCTISVDTTSVGQGAFVNTTGDLTSSGGNSGTASDTLTVNAQTDLSITKSDGVTSATPGGSLTYTIVATNSGPSPDGSVNVTDNFPADLTCSYTSVGAGGVTGNTASGSGDISDTLSMPSGSSVTYTANCAIDAGATGTLSNTATIAGSVPDSNAGNNSATDSDTVLAPSADLQVTLVDDVDPVLNLGAVAYTATVQNLGLSEAMNTVATVTLPAGVTLVSTVGCAEDPAGVPTCSLGNINAASSANFTVNVTVDAGTTGSLATTVAATSDAVDPVAGNNSATETTTVVDEVPVANAGPDQGAVVEATNVTLDGTASSDPNGSALTYAWTQTAGTIVTLSDATAASPSFTAPTLATNTPETLTFSLIVNDGALSSVADTVDITVNNVNGTPLANAGPDQGAVLEATAATLDGTASSDPDGDALTFAWTQTAGTTVALSDVTAASPTFTAPTLATNTPETLTFSLIVNDGLVSSVADTVDITITNVNGTPFANAGPDQGAVIEATSVTLDGSGSSDPDGDTLTFAWTQTAGTAVTLSDATASGPTFTAPTLATNTPETLTFSLIVNDGTLSSVADTVDITVTNVNGTPLANAGPDQGAVVEAASVTLDGSGSSDPDGDSLTYAWTQTAGTTVVLSDATAASPSFTAPTLATNTPETLTFSLIVNDGTLSSVADTVDITVTNVNGTPLANAGPDQGAVVEAASVTLDGSGSSDPDGDSLTYAWTQTAGTTVVLSDATAASPSFTAPTLATNTPETLTFSLIVNDGTLSSVADTVDITVTNVNGTPLANAGPDQGAVVEAASVTLDGSGSSDPDGDTLTFAWTQTAGTAVTLSDATASGPTFTAPTLASNTPETLTFSLIVNDGTVDSVADTVDITVTNVNGIPLASAGPDQGGIMEAASVTLDGTASSDPDGDALTYAWTQTSGTFVTLSDATAASPSFTAPSSPTATTLTFSLIVNDGFVDSVADQVDIAILENAPPTLTITGVPQAVAGPFTVTFTFSEEVLDFTLGDIAVTNGAASDFQQAPGDPLTYTALITPSADGDLTITVAAGALTDLAGNPTQADTSAATIADATAPSVSIEAPPTEVRGPFTVLVTFDEDVTGFEANELTLTNATIIQFIPLSAQSYRAVIRPTAHGTVTLGVAANVATDAAGNGNNAAATVSTEFIDENFVRTRTMATINNFLVRRADQITLNDPDLALRMLQKKTGGRVTGSADDDRAQVTLVASASGEDANLYKVVGADAAANINMWAEVNFSRVNAETAKNSLALAFVGIDYQVSEDTILGLMGQFDWANEEDDRENFSVSGNGWMVGPYLVSRLTDKLVFDGRAAWGKSDNEVSPFRTYTDSFDTNRWLLKGQFTGDFDLDEWRLNPSVAVVYFEEKQQAYTDSLGIDIFGQTVKLGRATFGPKFSKTYKVSENTNLTPNFSLKGVWDFDKTDIVNLNTGLALGTDDLRARTEAGFTADFVGRTTLGLDGFYDGIGAENYEAYGVKVHMNFAFD